MSGTRRRLTGRIQVALPPGEAFRLFTPLGERDWAHGWDPTFPVPSLDDTEPGTVFETSAHGQRTIWLVTGREPGRRISYARVTPGDRAGTVTVTVSAAGQPAAGQHRAGRHSEVEVTYELTALTSPAEPRLAEFADGFPAYLRSWQDAIAALLRNKGSALAVVPDGAGAGPRRRQRGLEVHFGAVYYLAGRRRRQRDGRADRIDGLVGRGLGTRDEGIVDLDELRLTRVGHVDHAASGSLERQHPDAVKHRDLAPGDERLPWRVNDTTEGWAQAGVGHWVLDIPAVDDLDDLGRVGPGYGLPCIVVRLK
jgi:hypothetical protein